jgi:response regulator RpfG family c-di-GMP phosphodiesterase
LSSSRVYKPALTIDDVVYALQEGRRQHIDPRLVELFLDPLDEVLLIKDRYSDIDSIV